MLVVQRRQAHPCAMHACSPVLDSSMPNLGMPMMVCTLWLRVKDL